MARALPDGPPYCSIVVYRWIASTGRRRTADPTELVSTMGRTAYECKQKYRPESSVVFSYECLLRKGI